MRQLRQIWMALLLTALAVSACSQPAPQATSPLTGTGWFEFALPDREPIRVFYAVGPGDGPPERVVFVMHGTTRNAEEYRDSWTPLLRHRRWVVVAPEFDREDFPGATAYNLGGVVDDSGDPRPDSDWTFAYIEPLAERVRAMTGVREATFDMFGHSAGAQFVHRYLAFVPRAAVRRAVAANAGWYTTPDPDVEFPYGLQEAPSEVDVAGLLAADLTVLLGSEDTEDENLRQDEGAARQGETRVERGEAFYRLGSELARSRKLPFRWSLRVVPGVAHDHSPMASLAAEILESDVGHAN